MVDNVQEETMRNMVLIQDNRWFSVEQSGIGIGAVKGVQWSSWPSSTHTHSGKVQHPNHYTMLLCRLECFLIVLFQSVVSPNLWIWGWGLWGTAPIPTVSLNHLMKPTVTTWLAVNLSCISLIPHYFYPHLSIQGIGGLDLRFLLPNLFLNWDSPYDWTIQTETYLTRRPLASGLLKGGTRECLNHCGHVSEPKWPRSWIVKKLALMLKKLALVLKTLALMLSIPTYDEHVCWAWCQTVFLVRTLFVYIKKKWLCPQAVLFYYTTVVVFWVLKYFNAREKGAQRRNICTGCRSWIFKGKEGEILDTHWCTNQISDELKNPPDRTSNETVAQLIIRSNFGGKVNRFLGLLQTKMFPILRVVDSVGFYTDGTNWNSKRTHHDVLRGKV